VQHRLFIAIDLPDALTDELGLMAQGVPGARWLEPDDYHLTLRFIGEVDGLGFRDLLDTLEGTQKAPFMLQLKGVGFFPPRGQPRTLWVGLEPSKPLLELKKSLDYAIGRAGVAEESRKFMPHITLARLNGTPSTRVARFLTEYSLFRSEPFGVDAFHLYSSRLLPKGAVHTLEATFPLAAG
jgi:2'-5' RNA ligase